MRSQFDRLPLLSQEGESYYLHLAVWRANARLSKKPIWLSWSSTREHPLENGTFGNRTQVFTEEEARAIQLEERAERQLEEKGEERALLDL